MTVVLGAHDLQSPEPVQQTFTISQVFRNNYNPEENLNDVLLIQVGGWSLGTSSLPPCQRHTHQDPMELEGWNSTSPPTPMFLS